MNNNIIIDYNYYNILIEKIPILKNKLLFDMIIEYCYKTEIPKNISNKTYEIKNYLRDINKYLEIIKVNIIKNNQIQNKHINNNEKSYILNKNNLKIKKHKLTADALMEAIVHTLVFYTDKNITVNVNTNISSNGRLNQTMKIAEGISLGNFILNIYNSKIDINNKTNINNINYKKNESLLNILNEIASKLEILQNSCGFIHGDFHSGNIFVNKDDITFIDFGYSTVRIPTKNNKYLILTVPEDSNITKYPFDILDNPMLKAIDMFHLIEDLISFDISKFDNKTDYSVFSIFIKDIRNLYMKNFNKKTYLKYGNRHFFTSSRNFEGDDFKILYPENFKFLTINNIYNNNKNNNKQSIGKRSSSSNNSFASNNNNNFNFSKTVKKPKPLFPFSTIKKEKNNEHNLNFSKNNLFRGSLFNNN